MIIFSAMKKLCVQILVLLWQQDFIIIFIFSLVTRAQPQILAF